MTCETALLYGRAVFDGYAKIGVLTAAGGYIFLQRCVNISSLCRRHAVLTEVCLQKRAGAVPAVFRSVGQVHIPLRHSGYRG